MPAELTPERLYAEEAAVVLEGMGLPPSYGKLLIWLLICDPPQQTSADLAGALGLSKGSVSTGMRMLEGTGMVRRVPVPGRRGNAYEMTPDAMIRASDAGRYRVFRELLDRGLKLIGESDERDSVRTSRLRETRDFYAFVEREMPRLVDEFVQQRQSARRANLEGERDG